MAEKKSLTEIVLMPVVVALVGSAGTYFITAQQEKNAQEARVGQLESARELAEADRQIKIIEIFAEKITSTEDSEIIMGLRLLRAIDGALAEKLANAVLEGEPTPKVRAVAQKVATEAAARGYSFAVVGSFRNLQEAENFAQKITESGHTYKPEIFLAENKYYAVTLGGYLTNTEASKRVVYAQSKGIAKDAYVRTSRFWGARVR